ncbi:MAG TPA: Asp-tRNA(Asn)/Glu-tRNA(Gln) amidotransferase subunit GatC [Verrucomicrobiae bacterium]|nr:Asp-tRNA(Asn)/Glu-tRNA(Gln) amidotransferase subunit GatC [Verrucomicrobiae bacterium]
MALTRDEVKRLAELARLALEEDELERMERTLDPILGYVSRLSKVDTAGVPETEDEPVSVERLREDRAVQTPKDERDAILSDFPERMGDLLKVPGVFENPKG